MKYDERTLNELKECSKTFKEKFLSISLTEQSKSKARAKVMQNHLNSIINKVMGDIPLDCVAKADMHVDLGFIKAIIAMNHKCLPRL